MKKINADVAREFHESNMVKLGLSNSNIQYTELTEFERMCIDALVIEEGVDVENRFNSIEEWYIEQSKIFGDERKEYIDKMIQKNIIKIVDCQ